MAILFHDEKIRSGIKNKRAIKSWLDTVSKHEKKFTGDVSIIMVTDEYLREINKRYLSRDCYTDVIAFDYSRGRKVSGDIFVSIDRVRENSEKYGVSRDNELLRVMVHGMLHLMGYSDRDTEGKAQMRNKEEHYISLYPECDKKIF